MNQQIEQEYEKKPRKRNTAQKKSIWFGRFFWIICFFGIGCGIVLGLWLVKDFH